MTDGLSLLSQLLVYERALEPGGGVSRDRLESIRATEAAILSHQLDQHRGRCTCGWEYPADRGIVRQHARHLATAIVDDQQ